SGLGLNCSETAETSCRRPLALREARRNRPLWVRMRLNFVPFDRMIDQERRLKRRRRRRTILATGPLWAIRLPTSEANMPSRAGQDVTYASVKGSKADSARQRGGIPCVHGLLHHGHTEPRRKAQLGLALEK